MELTSNSTLEETLNAFIADEHIASTQYKMAKVVAKGKALNFADKIFGDNGEEEDEHFDELVTYAQSLNIPVQVNPSQMEANCTTPFVDVTDGDSTAQLVEILISAEKKAISGYETALRNEAIVAEHPELTQFFGELLNDERAHLKELEDVKSAMNGADTLMENPYEGDGAEHQVVTTDQYGYQSEEGAVAEGGTFGESFDRTNTINILESVKAGKIDSGSLLKNLTSYLLEESVEDFVREHDYFDIDTAKEASPDDEKCCSHTLVDMVDDGLLDGDDVAAELLDTMSDSDVGDFGESVGLIRSDDGVDESSFNTATLTESVLSFRDIFSKVAFE